MTPSESHPVLYDNNEERPFLRRVRLRNYKSVGGCDVKLGRLTVLVGRNGAGKSNFLDALRFVADGLQTTLDHAIKSRGGIDAVRRRSTGHPHNVHIGLEWLLPGCQIAKYEFEIAAKTKGGFAVKRECLQIVNTAGEALSHYIVENGTVRNRSPKALPPASPDRLYLVAASSIPDFRSAYDVLLAMGFYNLDPNAMKELQNPDAGELLRRDGSNIASVIARLDEHGPKAVTNIKEYLEKIVPGIKEFHRAVLGPKETLEFRQEVRGADHPWKFYATNMSDGTLRALGALTAVMQLNDRARPVSLVGIEEPETALHPAAAGALMDALRGATSQTQVIFTTHSPDLLDQIQLETGADTLLIVESHQGTTTVTSIDSASMKTVREHLYSPGELLRMDQLEPDQEDLTRQHEQLKLPFNNAEVNDS